MSSILQSITLAGGCFWCTEAVFKRVRGVTEVQSGYANGDVADPSYEQVCSGHTGHAEAVRVTFDPAEIGLRDILQIFFATHDPTTLNRQGNDVGTQYRSGIYFTTPEQQAEAQARIADMNTANTWGRPVVTEVEPLQHYTPAEDYHQDYFEHHPHQGYCALVARPKVLKFEELFKRLAK